MDSKNEKSVSKLAKLPSFRPIKSENITKICMENVAGEQGLLTSKIFHANPSNFRKIQAAIKTHAAALGG